MGDSGASDGHQVVRIEVGVGCEVGAAAEAEGRGSGPRRLRRLSTSALNRSITSGSDGTTRPPISAPALAHYPTSTLSKGRYASQNARRGGGSSPAGTRRGGTAR
jgi:hypothetical protein